MRVPRRDRLRTAVQMFRRACREMQRGAGRMRDQRGLRIFTRSAASDVPTVTAAPQIYREITVNST